MPDRFSEFAEERRIGDVREPRRRMKGLNVLQTSSAQIPEFISRNHDLFLALLVDWHLLGFTESYNVCPIRVGLGTAILRIRKNWDDDEEQSWSGTYMVTTSQPQVAV